jgi:hypothetical protein
MKRFYPALILVLLAFYAALAWDAFHPAVSDAYRQIYLGS